MSFSRLQSRLREEGWFVGWNLPCCQGCAWWDVPDDADPDKVLFNHSQDCEVDHEYEECVLCEGDGCDKCDDEGFKKILLVEGTFDTSVEGFVCHTPTQQSYSLFCFSGDRKGVKNLKSILPIIEECGCTYYWDKTGKSRIEISWSNS